MKSASLDPRNRPPPPPWQQRNCAHHAVVSPGHFKRAIAKSVGMEAATSGMDLGCIPANN